MTGAWGWLCSGMLPVCALLMLLVARVKEKHSSRVMEAKSHTATQINEYLRGMKDLKAYHRTGEGFDALKDAMGNLRDESLKDEAVAGSLSNICASLVRFIVPATVAAGHVPASGRGVLAYWILRAFLFWQLSW